MGPHYQVSILPSGVVVSSTGIGIIKYMAMWPGSIFGFLQHLLRLSACFPKMENSFPREDRFFKPANVNMLLFLIMLRLLFSKGCWFQKGVGIGYIGIS